MRSLLPACWLLLWTLTVPVSCIDGSVIVVTGTGDDIKLKCSDKYQLKTHDDKIIEPLDYKDNNTGEYKCVSTGSTDTIEQRIYVKFRSCDNCIELDMASITGIVVGDLVATIVIGWAVYLIASQTRIAPVTPHKKRSDRQPLVQNDMSRGSNDHYQPLNARQKDTYDVLNRK